MKSDAHNLSNLLMESFLDQIQIIDLSSIYQPQDYQASLQTGWSIHFSICDISCMVIYVASNIFGEMKQIKQLLRSKTLPEPVIEDTYKGALKPVQLDCRIAH